MKNYKAKIKPARELITNSPVAKARRTTTAHVTRLSKRLGVTNKVLVCFFAEKHLEFGIVDPHKHYAKIVLWHPEDGHTMEKEIGAELEAFFQERPELKKNQTPLPLTLEVREPLKPLHPTPLLEPSFSPAQTLTSSKKTIPCFIVF